MNWFARRIHRYEQRRWKTDDNRLVRPLGWGLENMGGPAEHPDPAAFLRTYAHQAIENSHEWYTTTPATDYRLNGDNVLSFTSSIESPWPENNTVYAQFFPARKRGSAVLILPNWNAKWHGQRGLGEWLQRIGSRALKMSFPYNHPPRPPRPQPPAHPLPPHLLLPL